MGVRLDLTPPQGGHSQLLAPTWPRLQVPPPLHGFGPAALGTCSSTGSAAERIFLAADPIFYRPACLSKSCLKSQRCAAGCKHADAPADASRHSGGRLQTGNATPVRQLLLRLLFSTPTAILVLYDCQTSATTMEAGNEKTVLIVGGGFAGLSVAYALRGSYNCVLVDPKT